MKTIPLSLFVAGILTPASAIAQDGPRPEGRDFRREGAPLREGENRRDGEPRRQDGEPRRNPQRPMADFWHAADKDKDGFISKEEFEALPRVQNLPEEKRGNLFTRLDKDADGKLTRDEIHGMMKPPEGGEKPMQRLWELDADKSGGVSMEEFKAGGPFSKLPPDRQQALFQRLDTDADGVITPKDRPQPPPQRDDKQPRPWRPDAGPQDGGPPRMEPRQIIRQHDKDGDGAISLEEFRASPMHKDQSAEEREKRFQNLDRNHDGKLTAEDFSPPMPRRDLRKPDGESKPPRNPDGDGNPPPPDPR